MGENKIGSWFIKAFSYLYVEEFFDMLQIIKRRIKTQYKVRKFENCGSNPRIFFPAIIKGEEFISVGNNFSADPDLILQCWEKYAGIEFEPQIIIGNNAHLGMGCHITAINEIMIGDNLLTGKNVYISDHSHGKIEAIDMGVPPIERELFSKGKVTIGDNVWIGDNVCILPGVQVGNNAIIGANAVVTKDINDNCVVAGVPARLIKKLEDVK